MSDTAARAARDFDFLDGRFEVRSLRLADPLDPDSGWAESPATARAINLCAGAVSIDEMWFPDDRVFGMSLRIYNPRARQWSVYWISSRDGRLQPPVRGTWRAGQCWLTGRETYRDRTIDVSYSWKNVRAGSAHWQQCFSQDSGRSWQPNWTMEWQRTDAPGESTTAHPVGDFAFLTGAWTVAHRRLENPLEPASAWTQFTGRQTGWSFFDGAISVDELTLSEPGRYGVTFRTWDPHSRVWSIYWIDSAVGELGPPVVGSFGATPTQPDRVGTFYGVDSIDDRGVDDRGVDVRFVWDGVDTAAPRWRQAFSFDARANWYDNWEMRLARTDPPEGA